MKLKRPKLGDASLPNAKAFAGTAGSAVATVRRNENRYTRKEWQCALAAARLQDSEDAKSRGYKPLRPQIDSSSETAEAGAAHAQPWNEEGATK